MNFDFPYLCCARGVPTEWLSGSGGTGEMLIILAPNLETRR